jgi:hypothetical protein
MTPVVEYLPRKQETEIKPLFYAPSKELLQNQMNLTAKIMDF